MPYKDNAVGRTCSALAVVAACLLTAATAASAQVTYQVSVNTSTLIPDHAGPFALDFQFSDGSLSGDHNNTAMVTDLVGGTGFSQSTVNLTDDFPPAQSIVSFTPGSSLSFLVTLTTNEDAGANPDAFSFAIQDADGDIQTQDSSFVTNYSFVTISESTDPTAPVPLLVQTFDTADTAFQPVVTPILGTAAPEPGSAALALLALPLLAALPRRLRRATDE